MLLRRHKNKLEKQIFPEVKKEAPKKEAPKKEAPKKEAPKVASNTRTNSRNKKASKKK